MRFAMANTAEQIKLESISPLYYFDVSSFYKEATDKNTCL